MFLGALRHNGFIIALSLLLQLPFALGLALLLKQRMRGRALLRLLFFLPFVLSEVVTGVIWRLMLQPAGWSTARSTARARPRPPVARRPGDRAVHACSS